MMKSLTYIHVYLIQTILNILPFFWIDVFYDNQTYIGNQLNHPIYLFLWALSSAFGFYYYSKKIWEKQDVKYNKKNHALICLGMILSSSITRMAIHPICRFIHYGMVFLYSYKSK